MAASLACAQGPTTGWAPYADTFHVQKPYDLPVESRYSFVDGVHTCFILPRDKPFKEDTDTGPRTEMRWEDWKNQSIEHMFEADVMYEPGTNRTCIMQVKSNSSGEPLYMQVHTDGDLRNSTGTPFLRAYAGKWFNLKVAYHPGTRAGRVWIDDQVRFSNTYASGGTGWYFKNGAYNNGMAAGTVSRVHFRNFRFWTRGGPLVLRHPQRQSLAGAGLGFASFDLNGRKLAIRPLPHR
jgi:hypothetical protein